jgi:hypothetical protein
MWTAPGWIVERTEAPPGYTLEWHEPGYCLLSKGNRLFCGRDLTPPYEPLGTFPAPAWRSVLCRLRPAQRLLRFLFYNVLRLRDDALFATFDRGMALFDAGRFVPLEGLIRPCRVLRGACARDGAGNVYVGEYFSNQERTSVHVYRLVPGQTRLEIAHTFPAGAVRHIHGIYADPYAECLWCVTGDRTGECRVLRIADGFRTLGTVGAGDETWRTVSVLFTEDAVYYASDAEFVPNHLYRLDRKTGQRTVLAELPGPVYYSHKVGDDLFFAVTAELCPSQTDRCASLWHVAPDGTCTQVTAFMKDLLPVKYFMPGTLHFPQGPGHGEALVFQAVGLRGMDGRMYRLQRGSAGAPAEDTARALGVQ